MEYGFEFEKEAYVCNECGSEEFHANVFWHNGRKEWFHGDSEDGENAYWCHKCESETFIVEKEEWEDE